MMLCSMVQIQHLGWMYCLHIQGQRAGSCFLVYSSVLKTRDITFHWNISKLLPSYLVSYHRRHYLSITGVRTSDLKILYIIINLFMMCNRWITGFRIISCRTWNIYHECWYYSLTSCLVNLKCSVNDLREWSSRMFICLCQDETYSVDSFNPCGFAICYWSS
jgi:hypothetical protein